MLSTGEIDGQGAFILTGAERGHRDVGKGRNDHEVGEAVEEDRHEEVAQPNRRLFHGCLTFRGEFSKEMAGKIK